MRAFEINLDQTERKVNQTVDIARTSNSSMFSIAAKLAAIEAKLQRAQQIVSQLELPVRYNVDDYTQYVNPSVSTPLEHTEVSLEFQYTTFPSGLLFFIENTGKFSVYL